MKKYKLLSVLLASGLILTACGDDSSSSSETTTTTEQSKPKFEEKHVPEFIEFMEKRFREVGMTTEQGKLVGITGRSIVLVVPQDIKYEDRVTLQKFADDYYYAMKNSYKIWALEKGLDTESGPIVSIETVRGDSIASQKMFGGMELDVD